MIPYHSEFFLFSNDESIQDKLSKNILLIIFGAFLMEKVKLNFVIDCIPVIAETDSTNLRQFSLRLISHDFDAWFTSRTIMLIALPYVRFFDKGIITDKGLESANEMARGLYYGYLLSKSHLEQLDSEANKIVQRDIQNQLMLEEKINQLNSLRQDWKKKLKSNQIDMKEYVSNKKRIEDNKIALRNLFEENKKKMIELTLIKIIPGFTKIKESDDDYTAEKAVISYMTRLVKLKSNEFEKDQNQ